MANFKRLSLVEAVKFGFSTFLDNAGFYSRIIAVTMIPYLAIYGLNILYFAIFQPTDFRFFSLIFGPNPMKIGLVTPLFFLWAVQILFSEYLAYQYIRVGLQLYNNQTTNWEDFFIKPSERFFAFLQAQIWLLLKVLLGLSLLIIPGIYIAVKNYFVGFSIVDEKTTLIQEDTFIAQKLSSHAMWELFILFMAFTFLIPLPLMFIFLPFISLTQVHAYKQLERNEEFIHPES